MIGPAYWTTGVMLSPREDGEWAISIQFCDDGFCDNDSSEGTLKMRYHVKDAELEHAVKTVLDDAKRLDIEAAPAREKLALYLSVDIYAKDYVWPEGWLSLLSGIAERLDLEWTYKEAEAIR